MDALDPSKIPSLTPPEGVMPNFVDPETRAPIARVFICIGLSLMIPFVVLRAYSQLRTRGNFRVDDYLCFASAASVTAFTGLVLSLLGDPFGPHRWNVPLTSITLEFVTLMVVVMCMYAVSSTLVKCTLLTLYLQIFRPNNRARIMIWAGMALIVTFYAACIIATLVNCIPLDQLVPGSNPEEWMEAFENDRCSKPELLITLIQGFFSAITDLYVLAIPISSVLQLQMGLSRKIGVIALFLTGLAACAFSIAGTYYRWTLWETTDFTWHSVPAYTLGTWELAVGVICSCLPVVFVTLKGMSKSGPWATFMKYIRSKDRHNGAYHSDGPLPLHHPTDDMPGDGKGLPQVPRGTMTGMRTFIRNVHHSKPSKSIVVTTELHSFTGLASIDDSYHAQLQNGYFESSYTNQSNPSQASVTGGPKWSGKRY